MSVRLMQYTCCLFVLTSCLDQGDGRWKRKDEEKLRLDIDLFKEIAEKIEDEIDSFYGDYSEENKSDYVIYNDETKTQNDVTGKHQDSSTNDIPRESNLEFSDGIKSSNYNGSIRIFEDQNHKSGSPKIKLAHSPSNWPTFDDILLAIGKKYDWKNDRWIKIRRKEKDLKNDELSELKRINFMKIHKFSYSMVKLDKTTSKKNVVVAVSAVR